MQTVAIITRRLKEGKTYDDFRKAWYHTVGFGTPSRLYTALNVSDPREIIVLGFVEMSLEMLESTLAIDVRERLDNPLDEVIEPGIGRQFGLVISEDDFSASGPIDYKPPSIGGRETDFHAVDRDLEEVAAALAWASKEREEGRRTKKKSGSQGDVRER